MSYKKIGSIVVALILGVIAGAVLFINNAPGNSTTSDDNSGMQVVVFSNKLPPVLGIVTDANLKVVEVEKNSGAYNAGIVPGDVLKSINNTAFSSTKEAMQINEQVLASAAKATDPKTNSITQSVTVEVERAGKPLTLKVIPNYRKGNNPASNSSAPQPTPTAVPEFYGYF